MNNLYQNFIVSLSVLNRFFLYLDPLYVKCSDQFVQIFSKLQLKKKIIYRHFFSNA